ncbi:DUF6541 family protein [Modestobacter marinus]|uniref:DUF6541 family protein n=1 Tax=Modestobacter marinus TaxID=477641 RepID=UPI001C955646|nr:DUF6541 family protein [Modestobacter marinus]
MLLVFAPGLLLALAFRIRGWAGLGVAPLLTAALVVLAIVVSSAAGLRWTPLAAGAVTAGLLVLAALLGVWSARRREPAGPDRDEPAAPEHARLWSALTLVGVAVGGVVGFLVVGRGTGSFRVPNQGFDALFHVNAVEAITSTGNASPSVASLLNGYPEGASVYPDALHAIASLVAQLHGDTVTSINALMACIPLIAGVGLVALLRALGLVREAAVAPVLLSATTGYPMDPIWHGPIWVFAFGVALIPAFLVLLHSCLRERSVVGVVLLGLAAAGLALVHPSAAMAAVLAAVFLLVSRWVSRPADAARDVVVLGCAAVLAAVVALPLIGKALLDSGGGTIVDWPVAQSPGQAVGELLLYNYGTDYPQVWLAVPALLGLALGWRVPALRWWYGGTVVFAGLCVLAAAYEGRVVSVLTGPWWNDRFRFAALVFLFLAVFAAVGVVRIGDLLAGRLSRVAARGRDRAVAPRGLVAVGALALVVLVVGVLSKGFYVQDNVERLRLAYVPEGGGSVGPADVVAFDFLAEVADGAPVLNDPNDGSPWMWALAGVRPVFGAALTDPVSPPLPGSRQLLVDGLNCLDSDEDVRGAVEELGVRYVYSSTTTVLGTPSPNEGFHDLSDVESLRPVYERDGATVYEIELVPLEEARADETCALR